MKIVRVRKPVLAEGPEVRDKLILKAGKRRDAVVGLIRSAQRTLLLSIFRCDDLGILQELGEAAARGVAVQVLLTGRARGWGKRLGPLAGVLARMGVKVHRFQAGSLKYHAKYMVADGAISLVGTFNLTRRCFQRTRDFGLLTSDKDVAASLEALFHADASDSEGPGAGAAERLIVGPEASRDRIEAILGGAKRSIRIMDQKLSDPAILAILRDRERKGVSVQIDREGLPGSVPHGRLLVVDGVTAVFGSFALSERSLDGRRELAVVVRDPELVAKLDRQFDKSRKAAAVMEEAA